jgi:glucokinase
MNKRFAVGVDLGGTKIVAAVVDETGHCSSITQIDTEAHREREIVESNLVSAIRKSATGAGLKIEDAVGIGIGSPGPLDLDSGTILDAPNLPSLNDYPLKQSIASQFSEPVFVENDANAYVLGEAVYGAGKGMGIVVGLTLGTGLGAGLVFDGKVFRGATGTATELWKAPYRDSTYEDCFSSKGIRFIHQLAAGKTLESKDIAMLAEAGDEQAAASWSEYGKQLGIGLSVIVNFIDPDCVVLGGSVSKAFRFFAPSMEASLHVHCHARPLAHLKIAPGTLGEMAALLGAAAQCF